MFSHRIAQLHCDDLNWHVVTTERSKNMKNYAKMLNIIQFVLMVYYMQTQNKRGYELVQFVQAHKLIKQDSSSPRDFKFIYKQKNKFHAALFVRNRQQKAVIESISG